MKIGFIGLGIMGKPMAKNLIKAGHELVVTSSKKETLDEFKALGAKTVATPADIASECSVIMTMVPNSPQVRSVTLGKNGIVETAKSGTVLIDMSSIDPMESKAIGAELAKKGIEMMDAPVSGGEPKAIEGSLSFMCGAKQEIFDTYKDVLSCMGSSVTRIGDLGAGNTCKLANQVIVACNIAALSEAMMLAKKAGADPEKVFEGIKGGLAGSTVMNAKAPMILAHNYKPGFKIDLHIKDLTNALNAGHSVASPLPLTSQVMEMMQSLKADGCGMDDHSALAKFYEKIADEKIGK